MTSQKTVHGSIKQAPPGSDFRVPIPEDVVELGNNVGAYLREKLPEGWGFGVLCFEYNSTTEKRGRMFWLSSGSREDMVLALQEFVRKQGQ